MKFLILVKNRMGDFQLDDPLTIMKAAQDFLKTAVDEGVLDFVYEFATGDKAVAIANVDSAEELFERLTAYPLYTMQEYEVYPLADLDFVFEKRINYLQQLVLN